VLQIIALVLAFSVRKVNKVKGLNDTTYIAAAVYVTSIVLSEFVNVHAAVDCTGDFIGTTVVLGLVFVPKVRT